MSLKLIEDLRWGDCGKGKISTYLSHPDRCDVSARTQGADNAGHEGKVRGIDGQYKTIATNLLPAGAFFPGVAVVIARGVHANLQVLLSEIQKIDAAFNSDPLSRLHIANETHILFQGHRRVDKTMEERRGKAAIGSTQKGVAYGVADKTMRVGMRMEELKLPLATLKDRYAKMLTHWKERYQVTVDSTDQDIDIAALTEARQILTDGDRIKNLTAYWGKQFAKDARIVIEGAQGSLLNVDAEGYPYVTSNATTTAGHMQGAGIPLKELNDVIGVAKVCYDTRVGAGILPTEMSTEEAAKWRNLGDERGRTTGRDRRVGHFNVHDTAVRAWEESVTQLALLKGDMLDGEQDITFVTGLSDDGTPLYKSMPGWQQPIHGLQNFENFPDEAKAYYKYVRDYIAQFMRENSSAHNYRSSLPTFIGTGQEDDALAFM